MSLCTLGRDDVLLLLHPSLQRHLLLQQLLDLLGHGLQLRILVNTLVAASSCTPCHYFTLWPHGGGHHVRRQLGRGVFPCLLLLHKIHCQRKLLGVQLSLLPHVAQVPDVSKDVLWEASLKEHILDLHTRDETILVIVSLLKKCLVPESIAVSK